MEIYDYDVIERKQFDKTKSYYNNYYHSIILFVDYEAKSYNIAKNYNHILDRYEIYIVLYKERNKKSIPLVKDYTGGYKIPFGQYIWYIASYSKHKYNPNFNIEIEIDQIKDNPDCIIYHVISDN